MRFVKIIVKLATILVRKPDLFLDIKTSMKDDVRLVAPSITVLMIDFFITEQWKMDIA